MSNRPHGAAFVDPTDAVSSGTTYAGAIRLALADALDEQPEVFLYGQDIAGEFGGAFKITKDLHTRHPDRVINAPISEDAIAGVAIGAAMEGMRPVIEFQFADFSSLAFNQLVNHAATTFWRSGRPCPLVARLPSGGTPGGGPFHSQMPEAWYHHHPGLIVVAPATVADAYGMMRAALRQDDPVIFCEHKFLYERLRDEDFDKQRSIPDLGRAVCRRQGDACTIVGWSAMVHECLIAADHLQHEHATSCEVLDLRCLRPFDLDTVLASVSRTGRLVVVSEDFPTGGVAAEVVAAVSEKGFTWLDAPPIRVTAKDVPVPYHPELWRAHRPQAASIVEAVLAAVRF